MKIMTTAAILAMTATTLVNPAVAQFTGATTGTGTATTSDTGNTGYPNGTTAMPGTGAPATVTGGARAPSATMNQTARTTATPNASAVQTNNASSRTAAAPVPGRNSFTMGEASRRITSAGFAKVTNLKKDAQGIWRGQAEKDGAATPVSLDYQGNVTGR